ncbi:MAG: sigma-70 family RNA polymerase sigma factor [Chitinophagales bacterium]|nr:sigma-70 family RNA polymerase sigma factor [Chitinophagaceae bacterium]MCB9064742.1 sigma-70 family RNA polymerase sigma factor [Chitinophagales bacterium]
MRETDVMGNHSLQPEDWVDNYSDMLYRYTAMRVSDTEVAKDIVQDTFLSAWKARDGYKGDASEKNWLYTICRNKIIDHYRKASNNIAKQGIEDYEDLFFNEQGHWKQDTVPTDWGVTYTDTVETKEFYKILNECKENLKELQQAVFSLKYFDDMKSEDICKLLDITPSNYWVLMHRAKLGLRTCIEKNWFNK